MVDRLKPIPVFENESEERVFWLDHDSTEYVDWSKAELAGFPNLKPSMQTVSPVSDGVVVRSDQSSDQ